MYNTFSTPLTAAHGGLATLSLRVRVPCVLPACQCPFDLPHNTPRCFCMLCPQRMICAVELSVPLRPLNVETIMKDSHNFYRRTKHVMLIVIYHRLPYDQIA